MFVKFLPNQYILRYRKGTLAQEGVGLSFHCFERTASCCMIPISAADVDFVFTEQTVDYQSVTVQGSLTYRIQDYKKIASLFDFTIDLHTKAYTDDPLTKLSKRMIDLANVLVKKHISAIDLTSAIRSGNEIAARIAEEIRAGEQLDCLGIEAIGLSILRIAANNETTRALETGTREEILKQADIALYARRNASIAQERQVKENELNTEISVEEKKKQIRKAEIDTKRLQLEMETELKKIEAAAEIERKQTELDAQTELKKIEAAAEIERKQTELDAQIELERKRRELSDLRAENAKKEADAQAYRLRELMKAYNSIGADVLIALATLGMEPERIIAGAFDKLAANSGNIGTLNITPDLLESLNTKGKRAS